MATEGVKRLRLRLKRTPPRLPAGRAETGGAGWLLGEEVTWLQMAAEGKEELAEGAEGEWGRLVGGAKAWVTVAMVVLQRRARRRICCILSARAPHTRARGSVAETVSPDSFTLACLAQPPFHLWGSLYLHFVVAAVC